MSLNNTRDDLTVHLEKAILVSVSLPKRPWQGDDPLDELRGLATTAGARVVGGLLQKRDGIIPGTYIGKGKLEELKESVESHDADVVIFDNDLSPAQVRNLEKATGAKVIDRSELILDIFATRARSVEARMQVELAQLEYALPRLRRMWTHLSRYKGGIGLRGPGETQLEEDRRLVAVKIRDLKKRLIAVESRREREVQGRRDEHTVSLVGYTNAGKSTLMNALTGAGVLAEDKLFSTLDTRTRQWRLSEWGKVLLSDTVGFIRDLPHHLVASFKATLEEARQARLLLHVVDASSPQAEEQIQAVSAVLKELGCAAKPTLLVLNKVDQVADLSLLQVLEKHHPHSVAVSAAKRKNLDRLQDAVIEMLSADFVSAKIDVAAGNGRVLAYLSAHAEVYRQEFHDNRVVVSCYLPRHLVRHIKEDDVVVKLIEEAKVRTEESES
ncbi:MAG: GTPase HflX [Planctomycetes bacterium]|nr:GTPase HflX [Planctomycetota bacterium]